MPQDAARDGVLNGCNDRFRVLAGVDPSIRVWFRCMVLPCLSMHRIPWTPARLPHLDTHTAIVPTPRQASRQRSTLASDGRLSS